MRTRRLAWAIGAGGAIAALIAAGVYVLLPSRPVRSAKTTTPVKPGRMQLFGNYSLWWDEFPAPLAQQQAGAEPASNLRPSDYARPEACKSCHKKQYDGWSNHPHRWMNALVENIEVQGDFADRTLPYLGGVVTFYREGDKYCMRLERDPVRREYVVTQTIGSRFFQYYVGRQRSGPEPADHPLYHDDHVLPLGYWISRKEWVPAVHVHGEFPENKRHDPYVPRNDWPVKEFADYAGSAMDLYRSQCNFCHATFAAGDMFVRHQKLFGMHIPAKVDLSLSQYVQAARPELWPSGLTPREVTDDQFAGILKEYRNLPAPQHAVTLGVSCEACHLGNKDHAEGRLKKPKFFPHAPEAVVRGHAAEHDLGRTHDNINWACGRCHAGGRPQFAGGMATWNSTEYTDATRGSCYSQLTCVRCHNPHETLGQGWSQPPAADDAICLSCHQQYEPEPARIAHTHHPLHSDGARCMNCHMPRINEGLQEVVRTHTIYSPTLSSMIEANQPNACNQCHVEQNIDWTLGHLKEWYGKTYSSRAISQNYPNRSQPAAIGWLKSSNEAVRLVAADSLCRGKATWALPELLKALDDPFVLNRQFARIGLESLTGVELSEFGYQFYQTPVERRQPLSVLRERLIPQDSADPP